VTDDFSLTTKVRRAAQVDHASSMSKSAQNIKVADKISNLHGVLSSPPRHWDLEKKIEYFEFSQRVVMQCVAASERLRETFFTVYDAGLITLEATQELRS